MAGFAGQAGELTGIEACRKLAASQDMRYSGHTRKLPKTDVKTHSLGIKHRMTALKHF